MTNEEAAKLLDGEGVSEAQPSGNSEPAANDAHNDSPATVAGDHKPTDTVANAEEEKPGASETNGASRQHKPRKNFYSQERASHEFARQNRKMQSLVRENEDLKAQLEKLKNTNRENFVDKVSGKLDEEGYLEHLSERKAVEMQSKRLEKEIGELEDEKSETEWLDRVDRELGTDEAGKFNDFCSEVVDAESGMTRFGAFAEWLSMRDQSQVVASRVNASKTGIKLLKKLMTDKEARMSVVNAGSAHQMELALDKIEAELVGNESKPERKSTFADSWKARKKDEKPANKPKPTGSAFGGENKSAGPMHKDNDYFASLL